MKMTLVQVGRYSVMEIDEESLQSRTAIEIIKNGECAIVKERLLIRLPENHKVAYTENTFIKESSVRREIRSIIEQADSRGIKYVTFV